MRFFIYVKVLILISACSTSPYVHRADQYNRSSDDFGRTITDISQVVICYNTFNSTPDEIVKSYKEEPIFDFDERVEMLESCKYVDRVILPAENCITTINWMESNDIDYMVHGDTDAEFLLRWYSEPMSEKRLVLLSETKDYHTEDIKLRLRNKG